MLDNKMSENGKPDKIPDNPYHNHNLTLTGSGPFMSLLTHTHTHSLYLSTHSLSLSLLINTFLSFCTHSIYTSLSLSTHTPFPYVSTHPLSIGTHTPSLSLDYISGSLAIAVGIFVFLFTIIYDNIKMSTRNYRNLIILPKDLLARNQFLKTIFDYHYK